MLKFYRRNTHREPKILPPIGLTGPAVFFPVGLSDRLKLITPVLLELCGVLRRRDEVLLGGRREYLLVICDSISIPIVFLSYSFPMNFDLHTSSGT